MSKEILKRVLEEVLDDNCDYEGLYANELRQKILDAYEAKLKEADEEN